MNNKAHDKTPKLESERRQVTVIFADISGFTALNDAAKSPAEVEAVVGLVNTLLQELSEAVYEFDGFIDKYIGDEIMAVFGAPKAHENDPELALRAALSMMERLEKFNSDPSVSLAEPLGLHIGINTGTVIAGMVGTSRKSSYTVMGDAVNVAARLESVSVRGEIFLSEATYNLTQRFFVFEEREPVKVKGKAEPLKVYELKSARERPLQGPSREAPLIGRDYEIKTLTNLYNQLVKEKDGHILVVSGDAGLGKSRLVGDFRRKVHSHDDREVLWLFGRGLSYRQSFANRLFVDIIYSYLGLSGNADTGVVKARLEAMGEELFKHRAKEVVPFMATLLGLPLDEESRENLPLNDSQVLQQRTFVAVGEWIETLSAQQPVTLVFEDLHWADSSSVQLIEYLFALTYFTPLLLICVTRLERESSFWKIKRANETDYQEKFTETTLWPLTGDESRQVIKGILKIEEMPHAMEKLLLSRAEGNPLFLEEVLRSLIEEGAIKYQDDQWRVVRDVGEIDIPQTLQGVLIARIDRLKEPVKRVLQIAAVIGRVFPKFVLEPISGDPDIDEKLDELEAAELIEVRTRDPQPEYMFKHVLTYETAYTSMLLQQRKVIHKQIGDYMSRLYWQLGEEYAAIVAEHYTKSETWPRAFRYLKRAAEAAIQSFANREAVQFYTDCLEVAEKIPQGDFDRSALIDIYHGRARMLTRLGEPQQAIKDYETMLELAKDSNNDLAELRALNGIASLHANYYDFFRAEKLFQAALEVSQRIGDKRGTVDTLNQLGNFYYNTGNLQKSQELYEKAHHIAVEMEDEARRIESENGLAKILVQRGQLVEALAQYQEIIEARRRLGDRTGLISSLSTMLIAKIYIADYPGVDAIVAEVEELYQRTGDYYRGPLIKYYHAFSQMYRGEIGAAHQNLQQGLELARKQKQKSWQLLGSSWLGYCYLFIGLTEKAEEHAKQSYETAIELGSPLYLMRTKIVLGTVYRHLNQLDKSIELLDEVCQTAQQAEFIIDLALGLYQLAQACLLAEQWTKAQETVDTLLQTAEESDMPEFITRAMWLQTRLDTHYGKYAEALNTLSKASTLAGQHDCRYIQYKIQVQKASLYYANENKPASRDALNYAKNLQQKLIENIADEQMQTDFLNNRQAKQLQEIIEKHADN